MELKKLVVDSKAKWIEFGGLDGFSVEIANLSRKELTGIRKKCTTTKFNRRSRIAEEVLDDEKFVTEFTRKTVKNWKGLTLAHLEALILIDTDGQDLAKEVEYNSLWQCIYLGSINLLLVICARYKCLSMVIA